MILNSDVIYTFVLGVMLTIMAFVGWVSYRMNPRQNTLAPIRVRVDERRRGANSRRREEPNEINQTDIYFWLFIAMIITTLVLAYQI
jgi:hypothetical protein